MVEVHWCFWIGNAGEHVYKKAWMPILPVGSEVYVFGDDCDGQVIKSWNMTEDGTIECWFETCFRESESDELEKDGFTRQRHNVCGKCKRRFL